VVDAPDRLDVGRSVGSQSLMTSGKDTTKYVIGIILSDRRFVIGPTNAHTTEPAGIMSLSADFARRNNYGVYCINDWGGVSSLSPAMVFGEPQKFRGAA
jgi:hypothetical protein